MIRTIYFINSIIELTGGMIILFFSKLEFLKLPTCAGSTLMQRLLGAAVIGLGLFSYYTVRNENNADFLKFSNFVFLYYNIVVSFFLWLAYLKNEMPSFMPIAIHICLLFMFLYLILFKKPIIKTYE
jgi:hypothetical protein